MELEKHSYQNYAIAEFPDYVVIDTTYSCNVVCGMCHLNSKDFKIPERPHISIELIERMIPLLRESRSVFLLGRGEPLMHPKIYDIIALLRSECPGLFITFVTNGVLLTKRNIEKLLDLRLDRIHVSVDGPDIERGHPQFDKVKSNLRELALQKRQRCVDIPAIHFNYVIGKDNELALRPTLDFGIEVGLEGMSVEPLRILEPMPEWDGYINDNSIYQHLDTVVPILDDVRTVAARHGVEIDSIVPTRLDLDRLNDMLAANRMHRRGVGGNARSPVHKTPDSLKCDRPFKMLRVEMDGDAYMCPAALSAGLNAFTTDPIEIWNSPRFREVRGRLAEENYDAVCMDCHKLRNRLVFDAEIARKAIQPDQLSLGPDGLRDAAGHALAINHDIQGCVELCSVEGARIQIKGWAADLKAERPCLFAVALINGANRAVAHAILRRPDVASALGIERIEMCGFTILADCADEAGDIDVQVWAIDQSGATAKLSSMPDFVPVRAPVAEAMTRPGLEGSARQQAAATAPTERLAPGMMEIEMPDGVRVRVANDLEPATLRRIIASLRA